VESDGTWSATVKQQKKHLNIVSVSLPPEFKQKLDELSDDRGMTIKSILGRIIAWFAELDRTEQSYVLGQIENADEKPLADLLRSKSR
jgi:hypothetical protein